MAAGNQTRREGVLIPGGLQTLDYNDFNMPWRIAGNQGEETLIEYDAFEGRVAKRQANSEILYFGDLYERVSEVGAEIEHRYKVFAGSQQIAQISKTETSGVITDTTTVYLHGDHLGSVSALTDAAGQRVGDVRLFQPFGTLQDEAFSEVRAGFTGHEHDADLGLINMRGRLYDPVVGQFLQPDPLISSSNPRALNSYAYVMNNPLVYVDPSGFSPVWPIPFGGETQSPSPPNDDKNGDGVNDGGVDSSGAGMTPDGALDFTEAGPLYSGGVVGIAGGGSGDSSSSGSAPPPGTTITDVTPRSGTGSSVSTYSFSAECQTCGVEERENEW